MRILFILLLIIFISPVHADDMGDIKVRVELAEKLQDIRPVREQLDAAIDQYVGMMPQNQQSDLRRVLEGALNYRALEKTSIQAYADVYSEKELAAMLEYYSKPEAQSASQKVEQYAVIVYPEIIRMLDKAMLEAKIGR